MPYLVNKGELVVPGELIAEGNYNPGKNTYLEDDRIYASRLGLATHTGRKVNVVALKGCYMPAVGDLVIGKIVDMRLSGWIVDINAPYNAMLFASDTLGRSFNARRDEMSNFLDIGDLVSAKVNAFDRTRDPILTTRESGLGKITQGHVLKIMPSKIPRIIGSRGSMINMLQRESGCQITIGQNGFIVVSGKNPLMEALAIQAIRIIERDSHTRGLTGRIKEFLSKKERTVVSDEKKE